MFIQGSRFSRSYQRRTGEFAGFSNAGVFEVTGDRIRLELQASTDPATLGTVFDDTFSFVGYRLHLSADGFDEVWERVDPTFTTQMSRCECPGGDPARVSCLCDGRGDLVLGEQDADANGQSDQYATYARSATGYISSVHTVRASSRQLVNFVYD